MIRTRACDKRLVGAEHHSLKNISAIFSIWLSKFLSLFDPGVEGGGGRSAPHPAQTRIPVKNQWAEILIRGRAHIT